jgi:hypothetical protein
MTKDGSNPSKWTQAEREEDPDGFAAVEARAHYNHILRGKREAFVARFHDPAEGLRRWGELLVRRAR